ncbi:MAG: magnesium transporter [Spirochaetales bacterium]|nr:magnesium transporter [Spirochaetales bacterium]
MDRNHILDDTITALLKKRDWHELSEISWPAYETASFELARELEKMGSKDGIELLRILPEELGAAVLSRLSPFIRDPLIFEIPPEEVKVLLSALNPDDRSAFITELPAASGERLIAMLPREDRLETNRLMNFPEDSVGRLMTPDFITVHRTWSVRQVLKYLRKNGRDSETLSVLYVLDDNGILEDALTLNSIILSSPDTRISQLLDYSVIKVRADEDQEVAVQLMSDYDLLVLPVVDAAGRMEGIVTIDDILDVAQEETTEDFQLQAAVKPLGKSYWETGFFRMLGSRAPWLSILILVNLVSSGIIAAFEDALAASVALAFFIPLLIDTGGNSGSQSAMMIIRALGTGEIRGNQVVKTILREIALGALLGLVLGGMGFVLGWFRGGPELGLIIFISLFMILTATNLIGVSLPFLLQRFKLDPAAASGPLITTVADAFGLFIYFTTARIIMGI